MDADAAVPRSTGIGAAPRSRRPPPAFVAQLVTESIGYVPSVARRFVGHGLEIDELVAAGNLGLVQAALRFEPDRQVRFLTYADWWIRKAIVEAVELLSGPVRLPRYQYERLRRLRRSQASWLARRGREPTSAEMAREQDMTPEAVDRLRSLTTRSTSLDDPSGRSDARPLHEVLFDPDQLTPQFRAIERDLCERLLRLVATLPPQEERVILLRFGLAGDPPGTLRKVGARLEMSRERVRQIEHRALLRLRELIDP